MDSSKPRKDFLTHLEIYLSKRDGIDKLLKITRYATKILISTSPHHLPPHLLPRLQSFESSVGVTRKAFRLGKFIQSINSLRNSNSPSPTHLTLTLLAYLGEGFYLFIEQFIWLGKAGLLDKRHLPVLSKISAWCEFVGYFGSVGLKVFDLRRLDEEERCLVGSVELGEIRGVECREEVGKLRKVREKKVLKRVSIVQDLADGVMALADIREGRGRLSGPAFVSCAGMVSAVISTHKNWVSC